MTLATGTRVGKYEILDAIGAGGMGEVFRARDTKLNRYVAVKVLPESVASDPARIARLRREAQVLAAINHSNIAHVHELEESTGIQALIMELVEGPTLADRIADGPIPVPESLTIAQQIAEALAAAHDQGIVHRDLKPANIKLRDDGTVKVLDFGLAKLASPDASESVAAAAAHLPTVTTPAMTLAGVIMGTAAYMSPEQSKGRPADKRSDIWAFGAVLYEMLTGRRAFDGEDVSETLANVLKTEPDWSALPADIPDHIRGLLKRCLARDRHARVSDIGAVLYVLGEPSATERGASNVSVPLVPLWRRLLIPAVVGVIAAAAIGIAVWNRVPRSTPPPITRFSFGQSGPNALIVDAQSRDVTITPDGKQVIYKGTAGDTVQLFIRRLDSVEVTPLTTHGPSARAPFPSPDGAWVGFIEPTPITLKKVPITGGPALQICTLDGASRGATWLPDDTIVFATALTSTGLQRVAAGGGQPTTLTTPDRARGEDDHLWPQILPGGQLVLFTITPAVGGVDASQVAVLDLGRPTDAPKVLLRGGSQAKYLPSGHLVYIAGGTLRAILFDLSRLETVGVAVPLQSQVITLPTGTAEFDVSADGTLVYATGGAGVAPARTLVWVDREGREEPIGVPPRSYVHPSVSPDGARLAVDILDQENDIWVWDFNRRTLLRVSSDPGLDQTPAWLPDSQRLLYSSQASGVFSVVRQSADGTDTVERLATTANPTRLSSVSADGRHAFMWEARAASATDIMVLDPSLPRSETRPLLESKFAERNAELSPNGRWLAYDSNDAGPLQVYVRPFPEVGRERRQVSNAGGYGPRWSRDGKELFYLAADGTLMSVQVGSGTTWNPGPPVPIVKASDSYFRASTSFVGRTYDVSPDGKRFLRVKNPSGQAAGSPANIVVVRNWIEEVKARVPAPAR
jgi:serine/threonine protein kinase/Tol biopolymer transport system component